MTDQPRWRLTIEEQFIVRRVSWLTLRTASTAEAEALLDAIIAAQQGEGLDPVALEEAEAFQEAAPTMEERSIEWCLERTDLLDVHRLAAPPRATHDPAAPTQMALPV